MSIRLDREHTRPHVLRTAPSPSALGVWSPHQLVSSYGTLGTEIDSAIQLASFMAMSATLVNVAEFKAWLAEYLARAEAGEEIVVCHRNVPMVQLEPVTAKPKHVNRSQFGSMKGTVTILGDLTEPFIPENNWEMLK